MHTNKTRSQFLELRAQGWSLARIAAQIRVSKTTLLDWNRQLADEIHTLRALEREALHEKILSSHQDDLGRLAKLHDAVEQELASRKLNEVPTEKLFRLAADLRQQINFAHTNSQLLQKQTPSVPDGLTRSERLRRNMDLVRALRGLPPVVSDQETVKEQSSSPPSTPSVSSET